MTKKEENELKKEDTDGTVKKKTDIESSSSKKDTMAEKYTLYELVQKYGMDVEDLFIKLVDNNYFKQYREEELLFKNNGFIEPSITLNEFKKKMNLK